MTSASPNAQLAQLAAVMEHGAPRVAMATLVSASGSTPKKAGAKMLLDATGAISGTVTIGGCVDSRVLQAAGRVLSGTEASLLEISLGQDEAWELGLTCGGAVAVFVEAVTDGLRAAYRSAQEELEHGRPVVVATWLSSEPRRELLREHELSQTTGARYLGAARDAFRTRLSARVSGATVGESDDLFLEYLAPPARAVIVGAGEIARSLVPILRDVGMETIVVDARERFASRDRFPAATAVRVGIPSEIVAELGWSARTVLVLVAHDHKFELPLLRQAIRSPVGYIGLLGGRRRGSAIRESLRAEGFTDEELARIQSPIGLDIGARSTAEIALSIAAQIVAVERADD